MNDELPFLPEELERILPRVQTPGQYVGGELNAVVKDPGALSLRMALSFPDAYSVGMSHHGLQILYDIVNARETWGCERVFAPLPDMEAELREAGIPLGTLETWTPLAEMDVIGFSVTYELAATSILTILDLGGVELTSDRRGPGQPFVIAGGHGVFNPEPLADFIDVFVIGEAEEALREILSILDASGGRTAPDRRAVLRQLASEVEGVYVPSLVATEENADGLLVPVNSDAAQTLPVKRLIFQGFAESAPPLKPIVPTVNTVHERVVMEVMRGCPNGCRFCQAGYVCRPVRARPVETLLESAKTCYRNTGYDEIGLLSLSTSNYPHFDDLVSALDAEFAPLRVSLSLPSLRVDHALSGIPERFKTVRKSGFTIAPEAATDSLRARINKDVTNDHLLTAAEEAYRQGWQGIKLYFMIGLPTETDEDVAAIGDLANAVARLRRKGPKKKPAVTLSVSSFIPKPHTPLQWDGMDTVESLKRKQQLIAERVDRRKVSYKAHDIATSRLEGVFSRGDRRLGKAILSAWNAGARLDGWSDYFRPGVWETAFSETGIDADAYACGVRTETEPQPWTGVDNGVSEAFLRQERERMREGRMTPMCSADHCAGCGLERCAIRDGG